MSRCIPLAFAYFVADAVLDGVVIWIIYTEQHPWWAMIYAIGAGWGASINVKRYAGVPKEPA